MAHMASENARTFERNQEDSSTHVIILPSNRELERATALYLGIGLQQLRLSRRR